MADGASLQDVLEKLQKKWISEKPPFPESVIEAALLLDLFRDQAGLRFTEKSARRQQVLRGGNRCMDILLRLNPKTKVVVEIKQGYLRKGQRVVKRCLNRSKRIRSRYETVVRDCYGRADLGLF